MRDAACRCRAKWLRTGAAAHARGAIQANMVNDRSDTSVSRARYRHMLEVVARYTARGFRDKEVAAMVGLKIGRLWKIRCSPEYKVIESRILTGIVSHLDDTLYEEQQRKEYMRRELVPAAINALAELVQDRSKPLTRLNAAREILDRDAALAKVTRVSATIDEASAVTAADNKAAEELASLFGRPAVPVVQ